MKIIQSEAVDTQFYVQNEAGENLFFGTKEECENYINNLNK